MKVWDGKKYIPFEDDNRTIRVPTGFLGFGTPRYFQRKDVETIEECYGSCSAAVGAPITIKTKDGEVLKGYEQFDFNY